MSQSFSLVTFIFGIISLYPLFGNLIFIWQLIIYKLFWVLTLYSSDVFCLDLRLALYSFYIRVDCSLSPNTICLSSLILLYCHYDPCITQRIYDEAY